MKLVNILFSIFCMINICTMKAQNSLAQLVAQDKYEECLTVTSEMIKNHPTDSSALFYQGLCLLKTGHAGEALTSLLKAEASNFPTQNALDLNKAKCFTQLGKKDGALELLDTIVANGYATYIGFEDVLFAPIANTPQYQAAKDSVHKRAFPCLYDERYQQFDFWVGEWDVFVGDVKVGENVITKQNGGCMMLEQYTTARDYVGQSTNFFDPNDGLWKQIWIDKTQSVTKYIEIDKRPGYLQFLASPESTPVSPTLRMTFELQEDQSVTQVFEQQNPENKEEWQVVFNGIYRKKQ